MAYSTSRLFICTLGFFVHAQSAVFPDFPSEHFTNAGFKVTSDQNVAKAVIPLYLQDIVSKFNKTYRHELQQEWFKGVNLVCQAHVSEWMTRLGFANWGNIANEENKWVLQSK